VTLSAGLHGSLIHPLAPELGSRYASACRLEQRSPPSSSTPRGWPKHVGFVCNWMSYLDKRGPSSDMGQAILLLARGQTGATDALTETQLAVFEAIPARRRACIGDIALVAGVSVPPASVRWPRSSPLGLPDLGSSAKQRSPMSRIRCAIGQSQLKVPRQGSRRCSAVTLARTSQGGVWRLDGHLSARR
jgi:hypothetical protein